MPTMRRRTRRRRTSRRKSDSEGQQLVENQFLRSTSMILPVQKDRILSRRGRTIQMIQMTKCNESSISVSRLFDLDICPASSGVVAAVFGLNAIALRTRKR
mmetsp:Transcript_37461/g.60153  ORF Transcript_37461/g.60153 Transcript_37461/m.60153 type:complete len:101 (+) Transcript_37461:1530-1832(+)